MFELFKNSRGFTKEEAKQYSKVLDKLSTPTGRNFYDLLEGEEKNEQDDKSFKQDGEKIGDKAT